MVVVELSVVETAPLLEVDEVTALLVDSDVESVVDGVVVVVTAVVVVVALVVVVAMVVVVVVVAAGWQEPEAHWLRILLMLST